MTDTAGRIYRSSFDLAGIPSVALGDYVLEHAAARGDALALVDGLSGVGMTYAELVRAVDAAAQRLRRGGVGPGSAVALLAANQPGWVVAFYGALRAGATVVPVNPVLTPGEVAHILERSAASFVVADETSSPIATAVAGGPPVTVLALGSLTAPRPAGGLSEAGDAAPVDPGSCAVIAFSSGTTGLAKGVQLSHRNLVATLVQHEGIYHMGGDDTVVAALPLFHIYGMSMILGYALRHGATVVTMPRFDLGRYLHIVSEYRVTWLHIAPPLGLALLSEAARDADLGSVRHVVSGAAPLDPAVVARLSDRLGCLVGQGYGMTEASPGVTWVPDDGRHPCPPGSVGRLVAGTEARLMDPATGSDAGDSGELWVRGPQVMTGYLDDPAATAATVVDGWLRTGDLLRVDPDGVWWVVDRLKELIKYKGYQVAPAELEGVLLEHPAVADACVVGAPDPVAGELPVAWVATTSAVTDRELIDWVAERVAPYKRVRAIHFVEAVPRSPSGKLLRRQLRQLAAETVTAGPAAPETDGA